VEKYILEQIEALEDKVAAASMQVPVRTSITSKANCFLICSSDFFVHPTPSPLPQNNSNTTLYLGTLLK
jgi:hypothetical protein